MSWKVVQRATENSVDNARGRPHTMSIEIKNETRERPGLQRVDQLLQLRGKVQGVEELL